MRGFTPGKMKANCYADGGIIENVKGMLGFKPQDPERARLLAEYKANAAREKQAAKQPAATPVQPKALTGYAAGSALKSRMDEVDKYKDGGMIRGPGTGTSDSIPRGFKPGTFIMPADSTKAIGPEVLENVAKVPTKVSNGEFAYTPQEVHAVGINTLRQMKDATHNPKDDGVYFANGGQVRGFKTEPQRLFDGDAVLTEEEKKQRAQISPRNIYPQGSPSAGADIYANVGRGPSAPSVLETDQQAQADRSALSKMASGIGDANQNAGRAILDVASMVPRGLAGAYDSVVVRPMRAAGINAGYLSPKLVPDGVDPASMTPFTDQKRIQDGDIAGASLPKTPPAAQSNPTDMRLASGTQTTPIGGMEAPSAPVPAPTGVTRTGNSYTGPANIAGDISVNGQAPRGSVTTLPAGATPFAGSPAVSAQGFSPSMQGISAQNMGAADNLAARGQMESMGRLMASGQIQAPGAGPSFIMQSNTGFRRDPRLVAPEDAARRALRYAQGNDPASRERNAKMQIAQLEQQGLAQRNQATNDIAQKELGLKTEAQGFTTRAAKQMEQLRNTLFDPKATAEQKAQAQAQISALSVGQSGEWGVQVTPATKNVDGSTTAGSIVKYNKRTGETATVGEAGQGAAQAGASRVSSQAQFDALPKGATYTGEDGKTYRK